jgi:hypothetical protein
MCIRKARVFWQGWAEAVPRIEKDQLGFEKEAETARNPRLVCDGVSTIIQHVPKNWGWLTLGWADRLTYASL